MMHSVSSDLILDCLLMSHKRDARLIWVNPFDNENCVSVFWQTVKTDEMLQIAAFHLSSLLAKINLHGQKT